MATFVSAIYEYSTEYLEHKKVAGHNMIKTKIIEKNQFKIYDNEVHKIIRQFYISQNI